VSLSASDARSLSPRSLFRLCEKSVARFAHRISASISAMQKPIALPTSVQ
jgi:hypothetical protein